MRRSVQPSGTTLVELAVTLLVVGILAGLAAPPFGRGLDRLAVRGARDVLAVSVARARTIAVARGGARLALDVADATVRIVSVDDGAEVEPAVDLHERYGIALAVDGGRDEAVEIRFDGLGIGRSLGATIRIRRGAAEAGITVSAYGRVRTW
ncbi:MAG: pilus assembly FimT family protein [Gemmatimonadota bacterium]